VDVEAHRDDLLHAARCAWRKASEFGVDLSLVWESRQATCSDRLVGLTRGALFRGKARGTMELFNVEALLQALADAGVEFVVVGGVAATMHGSSYITRDLDVCYHRSPDNIDRLVHALAPLHPRLRVHGMTDQEARSLPFRFDAATIAQGVNFTLSTDEGPVDLLGDVKGVGDYPRVAAESEVQDVSGRSLSLLKLEWLIRAKRAAGRPKDLLVLPELEALLEMRRTDDVAGT